ncbi:MAG: DUF1564 domain-containing protein [Leptospira sp.]|nr:DUF1564 domain-containing protein [Leptospira sp.]
MRLKSEEIDVTILIQNNWNNKINYRLKTETSSTLNIPEILMPLLEMKARDSSQLTVYLKTLLNRYRCICYSGALPSYDGIKTKFQAKGQNMKLRSFRPNNEDWAELKLIAAMHGMTATFLFVILLEMDSTPGISRRMDKAFDGVDPTALLAHPISFTQTIRKTPATISKYARFGTNLYKFRYSRTNSG